MDRSKLFSVASIIGLLVALVSGSSVGRSWLLPKPSDQHSSGGLDAAALEHGRWRVLARSPIGAPAGASVVWDGTDVLEVGGSNPGFQQRELRAAAAFNPSDDRWRRIASVPTEVQADGAAAVWTGSRLFVFGGSQPPGPPPTGIAGLYDPTTNRWSLTPPAPVTLPSDNVATAWAAGRVVLAAVSGTGRHAVLQVVEYKPGAGRWHALALKVPAGHQPVAVEMAATNDGVLLWSLWSHSRPTGPHGFVVFSGVDVFRLSAGAWRNVTDSWPQHRTVDQPLFTGSRVLLGANQIWCGTCSHPAPFDSNGWSVNPKTLAITELPHGPLDDLGPQILWTGRAEIALNTHGEITGPHEHVLPGDIAFLNQVTDHWYRGPRAPQPLGQLPAVWDGNRLLVLDQHGQIMSYGQ